MSVAPREMIAESKRTKAGTLPLDAHRLGFNIGGINDL